MVTGLDLDTERVLFCSGVVTSKLFILCGTAGEVPGARGGLYPDPGEDDDVAPPPTGHRILDGVANLGDDGDAGVDGVLPELLPELERKKEWAPTDRDRR